RVVGSLLRSLRLSIGIRNPIRQRATGCGCFVLAVGVETGAHFVFGRHAAVDRQAGLRDVEVAVAGQQLVGAVGVLGESVGLRVEAHSCSSIGTGASGTGL